MGVARKQVVNHTVRGAFDYQGQKCSATSRMCGSLRSGPAAGSGLGSLLCPTTVGGRKGDWRATNVP